MSYKPTLPPNDEFPASLEQELPDDLAALGEQLQCDSLRLAQVYPPCSPPPALLEVLAVRSGHARWSRWRIATAASAAAVLLAVGWASWSLVPDLKSPGSPAEATQPRRELAVADAPASTLYMAGVAPQATPVSYRPEMMELNGPQLEGLLDLWSEQPEQKTAVSF